MRLDRKSKSPESEAGVGEMAATKDISIRENDLNGALLSAIKLRGRGTSSAQTTCNSCRNHTRCNRLPVPLQNIHLCDSCIEDMPSILSKVIEIDSKAAFETLKKREKKRASARLAARRKKQNSVESMAQPYVEIGLAQVFAEAIARDHSISDSVLDLWEATWWKQYEPDDPMITSVLNGQFTEAEAKWMDTFRSDHLDMVWALLNDSVTIEWARALLDSGFNGNIEQVTAALDGGSPKIIARISKLKCNADMIPPRLDAPADCTNPSPPEASSGGE